MSSLPLQILSQLRFEAFLTPDFPFRIHAYRVQSGLEADSRAADAHSPGNVIFFSRPGLAFPGFAFIETLVKWLFPLARTPLSPDGSTKATPPAWLSPSAPRPPVPSRV
jgi:hypothetical protein